MTDPYTLIATAEKMIGDAIKMLTALDRIDDGAFRRLFEVELLLSSTLADAEETYGEYE